MTAPLSWGSESSIAGAVRPSRVHDEKMRDYPLGTAAARLRPKTDAAKREVRYPLHGRDNPNQFRASEARWAAQVPFGVA